MSKPPRRRVSYDYSNERRKRKINDVWMTFAAIGILLLLLMLLLPLA